MKVRLPVVLSIRKLVTLSLLECNTYMKFPRRFNTQFARIVPWSMSILGSGASHPD